ncbi:MAG TPA: PKD domain-containing protein [Planctomycetota bacterium]|nr:PKD domain-containing protein [Planctomycetota bacterium]
MRLLTTTFATLALLLAVPAFAESNPIANAGPNQTVSAGPNCQTTVTLDGTASSDPDGDPLTFTWAGGFSEGNGITTGATPTVTLGSGVHNILLVVDDGHGGLATSTVQITVNDVTPPVISGITANPATLWPPNHKMVSVTVMPNVTDNCDPNPVCKIISVTSNEPDTGNNKKFSPDFNITGNLTVDLRAERAGSGSGRIYTLTIQCTDKSGNSSTSTVDVTVPHDQGHSRKGMGQF